jgi:hypothetical protein
VPCPQEFKTPSVYLGIGVAAVEDAVEQFLLLRLV